MIIDPYKRTPIPPTVCVLDPRRRIVNEHGELRHQLEKTDRVFTLWDISRLLLRENVGEALCWNNDHVRYRLETHPEEPKWVARPSDAYVLRWPFDEKITPLPKLLHELARYRDWLAGCGAAPTGTTGSAAMSLLRARLETRLTCSMGDHPPLLQTRGGRTEVGPSGPGRYSGRLELWDMPAAYATELGVVKYGGVWRSSEELAKDWRMYADAGMPVFVHARVTIPDLPYGPLPRTFRRRVPHLLMQLYSATREPDGTSFLYPTRRTIQGTWTLEEIEAAETAGCRVKPIELWVHIGGWQCFAPWWETVQQGRGLGGVAGAFGKMTANALWGRFCLDPKLAGRRTIVTSEGSRVLESNPAPRPAHDLAELVAGRVRARLFTAITAAGDRFVSAHTDGLWTRAGVDLGPGWRRKVEAKRLDLIDPQTLRYRPVRARTDRVVMAGFPYLEAPAAFAARWDEAGMEP